MDLDVYGRGQKTIDVAFSIRSQRYPLDHPLHDSRHRDSDDSSGCAGAYFGAGGLWSIGDDAGGDRFCPADWPDGLK